MTNNIINYIYTFLNLISPIKLYKQYFYYYHIIYNTTKFIKYGLKNLDICIPYIKYFNLISKIIIFFDSVDKKMSLIKYLHKNLLDNLKKIANQII